MITTSTMAEAATDLEEATEPGIVEAPRLPKKRIAAAPPPPNPSYQRIVQPDGKVHYKKTN
ncbi:MAG: hypothetical protein EOR83_33910 [Mesorhizobium sp.]|nr:MAG: hypothetical protein EOR83_33910 [Mesorhizobium sp.]